MVLLGYLPKSQEKTTNFTNFFSRQHTLLEGVLSRKKVCGLCGFFLWSCSAHNLMLQVSVVNEMTFFLLWFFLDVFSCGHVAEERAEQYNLIDAVCQELQYLKSVHSTRPRKVKIK
mgnify:CR=1 FL=1